MSKTVTKDLISMLKEFVVMYRCIWTNKHKKINTKQYSNKPDRCWMFLLLMCNKHENMMVDVSFGLI